MQSWNVRRHPRLRLGRSRLPVLFAAVLLAAPGIRAGGSATGAAPQALRILVTNDDGYRSPGLQRLVTELATIGTVIVAAPSGNRSGSSHSIALGEPLRVEDVEIDGASAAYAVDGSPAAAVRWAILTLGARSSFDLVVSGINRGANVGMVAHYSGTVGAAMEALLHGVPSFAVSQEGRSADYTAAARFTARLAQQLERRGFPSGVLFSINVPAAATTGDAPVVAAPMGGSFLDATGYRKVEESARGSTWQARFALASTAPAGTDSAAYLAGKITVTPLRVDWTDAAALEELAGWLSELD